MWWVYGLLFIYVLHPLSSLLRIIFWIKCQCLPIFWKVLKQGYSGAHTPLQVEGHAMTSTSPRFLSSMSYSQLFSHQTLFTVLLLFLTIWFGECSLICALEVPPPSMVSFWSSTSWTERYWRIRPLTGDCIALRLSKERRNSWDKWLPNRSSSCPWTKRLQFLGWPLSFHNRLFCCLKLGLLGKVQSMNSASEWGPSSGFEFSLYLHMWAWSASSLTFLSLFLSIPKFYKIWGRHINPTKVIIKKEGQNLLQIFFHTRIIW